MVSWLMRELVLTKVTLSTTLKALSVSALASLGSCKLLHCYAVKSGFESDVAVSCSLIEAYARCGHVKLSRQVFDELPSPNVICFTSIIHGYARNGMGSVGLHLLKEMVAKGFKPDEVTILCVLSGCNQSGRAGLLEAAEELLQKAPEKGDSVIVELIVAKEFHTAMQIREFAIAQQVTKDIGHSLVEINSQSHR
ncbi:hypothetical protein M0R45_022417 [Rubus argutus]|uniref:Pentatricopeptide repeat-containing protein n=1 Tax=Rubus argutus TaxID=59490 RepID=A0AAW1XHR5_RUBAR